MENQISNINILRIASKWRLHLLVIFILSLLLSSIFSGPFFIEPKYKSYAIIYPSNLIPYSSETATEQMLQIFKSDEIRDSIIKSFDLVNYYKINTNNKYFYSTLIKTYNKNISIKKTEFESVLVEVLDKNPERACEMVKELIKLFNKKVRELHKQKSEEVLIISSKQLIQKENQIDSVNKLLKVLSSDYNIIDFESQAKEVTRGFLKTIDGSGATHVNNNAVAQLKKSLEEKGGDYILLNSFLKGLTEQYIELQTEYEIALRDVNKVLTYTNVVSSPIPADKKDYPIRWLIVFIFTLSTMFISFLIIIYIENLKKINK